jgi:hypothetical protein
MLPICYAFVTRVSFFKDDSAAPILHYSTASGCSINGGILEEIIRRPPLARLALAGRDVNTDEKDWSSAHPYAIAGWIPPK